MADRITHWSTRPDLNVHKIIALVAGARGGIGRNDLVRRVGEVTRSKNPYGAVASLLTESGNAYGRVFADNGDIIRIHPEVEDQVRALSWNAATRTRSTGTTTSDKTSQEKRRVLPDRIAHWSRKPDLNVHKIIALVAGARGGISRGDLVRRVGEVTRSKNAYGAVASLLTDSGNAYGRVFVDADAIIRIHPEVEDQVQALSWNAG